VGSRFHLVAKGGIEPPTRGFSIPVRKHSPSLMDDGRVYVNQHVEPSL
jgi:hypothetical protein